MKLQTKAFVNLVRMRHLMGERFVCAAWQLLDWRSMPEEELFERLQKMGIELTREAFLQAMEKVDSPEDLALGLCETIDEEKHEAVYLCFFELWRKLSEKQTPSIFGDEVDYRMFLYDTEAMKNDELVQTILFSLEELLQGNVDAGMAPKKAFLAFQQYCAHDLESFIYEYIYEQIESGNLIYASDLIDDFYAYMAYPLWFDFLLAYLYLFSDVESSNEIIKFIVKDLLSHPDFDLQMEVLKFMSHGGDSHLFLKLLKATLPMLEKEGDFKDLLETTAEYFRRLDKIESEQEILKLLLSRSDVNSDFAIDAQDLGLLAFSQYLISTGSKSI